MPRKFPTTPAPFSDDDSINYSIDVELNRITGQTLVIGDTLFLSDEGIKLLASTDGSYHSTHAFSFIDAGDSEIGGMYGRDDAGQNVVGFRVVDQAEDNVDTALEIASTSTTAAVATVQIQANRSGESTDTYLALEKDGSTSEIDIMTKLAGGRVRIAPRLNLLGPSAELLDLYITGSFFVLKYNDAGTTRYKYLDLSGTAATWAHSTSEP